MAKKDIMVAERKASKIERHSAELCNGRNRTYQENGRLVFCVFIFRRLSLAVFVSMMVSQPCLRLLRIVFGLTGDISTSFHIFW